MLDRAFFSPPPDYGSPLLGARATDAQVTEQVRSRLSTLFDVERSLEVLESELAAFALDYGLKLNREKGVPQVNWDSTEVGALDFRHTGGPSAYHELVHVCQCLIGGAAAFGTEASRKYLLQKGRPAESFEELKPFIDSLTLEEKQTAFDTIVKPMESQAYSRYEESAFHATGFMGKRSKDRSTYRQRMKSVVSSFAEAYKNGSVPKLESNAESRVYGSIGHVARTNGETALLLGGAGLAYYSLAKRAVAIHPAMALPVAAPLGYLLYRSIVSG